MHTSGYLNHVYELPRIDRMIPISGKPSLKINRFYRRDKKSPILRVIWLRQSTDEKKVIILDEIWMHKKRKELRLRYHVIGDKGKRMYKKWTFGQFATIIPHRDFRKLIQLAKKYRMI